MESDDALKKMKQNTAKNVSYICDLQLWQLPRYNSATFFVNFDDFKITKIQNQNTVDVLYYNLSKLIMGGS